MSLFDLQPITVEEVRRRQAMGDGETLLIEMKNGRRFRWVITGKDATCQKCGAPIWWVQTHKEKFVPADEPELGHDMTTCHFDTCEKHTPRV